MRNGDGELGFACPKCGNTKGNIVHKTKKIRKSKVKQKSGYRSVNNSTDKGRARKRYETQVKTLASAIQRVSRLFYAHAAIAPLLEERYPFLGPRVKEFASSISLMGDLFAPAVDKRCTITIFDWLDLISDAGKRSYRKAARENPIINSKGEKKILSGRYVKRKRKEILEIPQKLRSFLEYIEIIAEIKATDSVIRNKFATSMAENQSHQSQYYQYTYCYIHHYNPDTYRQRKEKYEAGKTLTIPTGIIECGPFKEDELLKKRN